MIARWATVAVLAMAMAACGHETNKDYAAMNKMPMRTVSCSSGAMPRSLGGSSIKQQFGLTGFKHEGSYRDVTAQIVTLYALQKIAATAKVPA